MRSRLLDVDMDMDTNTVPSATPALRSLFPRHVPRSPCPSSPSGTTAPPYRGVASYDTLSRSSSLVRLMPVSPPQPRSHASTVRVSLSLLVTTPPAGHLSFPPAHPPSPDACALASCLLRFISQSPPDPSPPPTSPWPAPPCPSPGDGDMSAFTRVMHVRTLLQRTRCLAKRRRVCAHLGVPSGVNADTPES